MVVEKGISNRRLRYIFLSGRLNLDKNLTTFKYDGRGIIKQRLQE